MSETAKSMMRVALGLSVVTMGAGACFYLIKGGGASKVLPFVLGVAWGTFAVVAHIFMTERSLLKVADMPANAAKNYFVAMFLVRYVMLVFVLIVSAVLPIFNLFGTIFGVLLLQISAYGVKIFERTSNGNDKII